MNIQSQEKLVKSYNAMMGHLKQYWLITEEKAGPPLKTGLDKAIRAASDLGELTREEAEKVGGYVKKDLEMAANYMSESGKEFKDWVKSDIKSAEGKFADMFAKLADKTRIEFDALADRARQLGIWHTGEITGIGTLTCEACGEKLHFGKPGHVPPCPKCRGTVYKKTFAR